MQREIIPKGIKDEVLKQDIERVWIKHPAYGYKRFALELEVNHKRILRVMKLFGIKPPRRKVHCDTTRSTSHHTYTNLIKDLIITKSNQLWCSDLSYIKFQSVTWYLTTIEDIFTRQVIGYQESFFGKFKDEIGDLNRFETVGQFIEAIYQQIHYYNYERIQTKLKMPPVVYAELVTE